MPARPCQPESANSNRGMMRHDSAARSEIPCLGRGVEQAPSDGCVYPRAEASNSRKRDASQRHAIETKARLGSTDNSKSGLRPYERMPLLFPKAIRSSGSNYRESSVSLATANSMSRSSRQFRRASSSPTERCCRRSCSTWSIRSAVHGPSASRD